MSSESYHEPYQLLTQDCTDMHRALVSVQEELEAIDWYQQRAEACADPELKAVLLHNKNEEMEHAMMGIEWIRRHSPRFDEVARQYMFSEGSLLEVEKRATAGEGGGDSGGAKGSSSSGSLGIGSLRRKM